MKKFIYALLTLFILFVTMIVIAANSSFVIKKAADTFAPDYNITYKDITGNIFTGVRIDGLAYGNKPMCKQIRFSWNPSKILYKRIAVNEVGIEALNIDTVKALIASFPQSDDNSSSTSFPLTVTVGSFDVTLTPFMQNGIAVKKSALEAEDLLYASDAIEVAALRLAIDTNVTNLKLQASLENGKVTVENLELDKIDSVSLQKMFIPKEEKVTAGQEEVNPVENEEKDTPLNPLIPREVAVKHFNATLKPRSYQDAYIERLDVTIDALDADVIKMIHNKQGALNIGNYMLDCNSSVGDMALSGNWKDNTVTLKDVTLTSIDTMVLKTMFAPENNASSTGGQPEETLAANERTEMNATASKEANNLIPKKVRLKTLHTDLLPMVFDPVKITSLNLDARNIAFDVEKLLLEKGSVSLNGKTNLTDLREEGKIVNNSLSSHITLTPKQTLFDLYKLPLRKEAIGNIGLDVKASKDAVKVFLDTKAKQILVVSQEQNQTDSNGSDANRSKPFNVDIDSLKSFVDYRMSSGKLSVDTNLTLSTPYARDINITNHFVIDGRVRYFGEIKAGKILGLDEKLVKPAEHLHIGYSGDLNSVKTDIEAEGIKGYFISEDFNKSGHFHLQTKEALALGRMVVLPSELNAGKANAVIDVPLNFAKLLPIEGTAKISSNLANVDAKLSYGDNVTLHLKTEVPKNSLLKNLDKNIQWSAISPLNADVAMGKSDIRFTMKSKKIVANMQMEPYAGTMEGSIKLAGLTTTMEGESQGDIIIKSNIGSFKTLLKTVNQFYTVKGLPKVDGKLTISLVVDKKHEASLLINSPQIIYHADRKTEHVIDNVNIMLMKKGSQIELSTYNLTYNNMLFYASKPSIVTLKDDTVTIPQLWLNDQLKVTGELNSKTMQGEIVAEAPAFHFSHEMIDLDSKIGITSTFNGENTDVKGKVTLLGGEIHYDMSTKTFPSDSDIMIVQDMKDKEPSAFMDHLTMEVNVDTQKPLVYHEGDADIQANVTLGIHKSVFSDPMIIGSIDLVDGGSYQFQGKKFVLERSHIYLTGDPSKPMLDITVKYKALRHIITINVTGTPAVPNVLFSSVPSLTKEQILSIILFDSEEGADTNSANDMMKMMGGAMAKSALNNLGVKLDHLVIGEGNSVEVGKKLTDDVTVIYINGEVPKMEMRYDYNPSVEVVVGASEESESLDVVYRKDFNMKKDDDIVIKSRKDKRQVKP